MTYRVLVSAPYFQPVVNEYRSLFAQHGVELIVPTVHERLTEAQLLSIIADIDGVISGDDAFTDRVFQKAARLKVISKWGTGIDSIDAVAAKQRGVRICNTPDAFTQPVADTVLGYMLCFARRFFEMDRAMKAGQWKKIPGVSLRECTLGIVGVGNIGKAVARRAAAFGTRLIGHDIKDVDPEFLESSGMTMVSRDQLFAQSDFVSLNCDLNRTSRGLLDKTALAAMKPTAFVINTSRGPVVNESALVDALRAGRIAGAAMDVFEDEPLPASSPLRSMDNCLLAPHNSNSSPAAWRRVHENTVRNLLDALNVGAGRAPVATSDG